MLNSESVERIQDLPSKVSSPKVISAAFQLCKQNSKDNFKDTETTCSFEQIGY